MTTFYLTWLNPFGGFDYWPFIGRYDLNVEIEESGTTNKNIFPGWPKSYGADADTIKKQTFRRSRQSVVVRSQNLTREQVLQLRYIKTSPLVQVLSTRHDRVTVIPDTNSFTVFKDIDKMHTMQFTISYTNPIPSQHT